MPLLAACALKLLIAMLLLVNDIAEDWIEAAGDNRFSLPQDKMHTNRNDDIIFFT